jgi:hypothetical protein
MATHGVCATTMGGGVMRLTMLVVPVATEERDGSPGDVVGVSHTDTSDGKGRKRNRNDFDVHRQSPSLSKYSVHHLFSAGQ